MKENEAVLMKENEAIFIKENAVTFQIITSSSWLLLPVDGEHCSFLICFVKLRQATDFLLPPRQVTFLNWWIFVQYCYHICARYSFVPEVWCCAIELFTALTVNSVKRKNIYWNEEKVNKLHEKMLRRYSLDFQRVSSNSLEDILYSNS